LRPFTLKLSLPRLSVIPKPSFTTVDRCRHCEAPVHPSPPMDPLQGEASPRLLHAIGER
ncbi:transposase IS66 family protein, partial [Sesbania bispinosa]